ncbi:MAG TPA: undecaprenyldiphospho-muramoylpentapeptide beta-N-acetylglucosaminyltransferase [Paenalcaligenes hominis]|uniref:UDP-N-acetylglucosamine--N-acetylmuramyl-(pentapeptide) pyrophosphoryl-undecaprenol N-acetylglucosamine transferase n=1 Tax=Paenalcaligenes hominis TaxID=643674 RepID=A0A9D2VEE0_9BURK|nr:undecaprenyldiphospho-muramoylpentapeptide beta-N-acetylglucosaminyltransferase [Paenalcaligenes hominis]NJB64737.1 UDP-N-acetylglucosamine--N-acetylmuramyl-(pentapeptide) pyrophosphoryl-undecaprenol N-acetylglucosamine transferase [Paenalcaligenes hominis]GGE59462.1 UDP-N-acetylglucosamine--N-acetylmuramyl-(pentapeptide) pyrophosphoryl-undecaprenol N-acetylglucosamine transferase [Paenalcaligenes hominis]HJH23380.1 undecaprenyldiphospho-muramoylpentapeptide beta-N-acetylglucosaminyltransfera
MSRSILIMAGGTGGHIMPGLAVAHYLRAQGWRVYWLGNPDRMEGQLVKEHGFPLLPLHFSGVRGKGLKALLQLPFRLLSACVEARRALQEAQPNVVLGMGGYVAFPGGIMAKLAGIPLVVHEQNAIGGTANRYLAKIARQSLVGFPGALPGAIMVGNPVRNAFTRQRAPAERYQARKGTLQILVLGGSLGAAPLNKIIPAALAQISAQDRPYVVHQTGQAHTKTVQDNYDALQVHAQVVPFITDVAAAMAAADVVICRAGAMTVAEVAAVGVAALFVPLPHAIDDHQTANANYLSDCAAAWLQPQAQFTVEWLAQWLQTTTRAELQKRAIHAQEHSFVDATEKIANTCLRLAKGNS